LLAGLGAELLRQLLQVRVAAADAPGGLDVVEDRVDAARPVYVRQQGAEPGQQGSRLAVVVDQFERLLCRRPAGKPGVVEEPVEGLGVERGRPAPGPPVPLENRQAERVLGEELAL
jgi:hypothetical protein